ncbi:MAG: Gamma-glutamyltranspeptidase [Acidobacteria bacterium]|nr:Gamma-glutamyltranspeptidase [Acidobacteriota bacterium]NIM64201.1 Gamma-glutamyltranspeptidase [Acidobacteriota bacterium]NIO59653.1 Gamma-glutamyltranspeptidase [Acidobacteriota bacterium]NIQ30747.1 Gamma-glutamyltranspeptidase [Acidobacteriota bacterium]NIQ85774.1 Gamma-glutamyltranspeptidase [Acidobacteriota bacterium]
MAAKGAVAAGHPRTAEAATEILLAGGNAFDAALAGMCAACAAEPMLCSLGGGGHMLARAGRDTPIAYDFFVHTPLERPPGEVHFHEVFCDFGTARQPFHIGLGSIATPGVVRGLFEIHRELGSMPIRDVMAPAIALARDGVEISELHAFIFRVVESIVMASEASREIYASRDDASRLVGAGEILRQPQLAETLEVLAIEGDDLFYRGEIAQAIDRQCREGGGSMRLRDLESYEVERHRPLASDYRGVRMLTMPPPSSGGVLIVFALKLLEAVRDLGAIPFGSTEQLGIVAEALDLSNRARVEALVDDSSHIDQDVLLDEELLERYRNQLKGRAAALRGTTSLSVIDSLDNVATLSLSNGEGCGEIVPGTGLMLNNMLGEEDLVPQGFHRWPLNQRMTSMMAPSVLLFPDGRLVATGSGGSKRIRTAILHLIVNLIDYDTSVEEAVNRPRIFLENGHLSVEGGYETAQVERLVESYPEHRVWDEINLFFGGAHTVQRRGSGFEGAGDPRRAGVFRVAGGN